MKKQAFRELIRKNLQGRKIIILFLLTNIIYALMLTVTIPEVMYFSEGMKLPDLMPTGYSHEYINTLLHTLCPEGRHTYLFRQLPLDMIYPLLFGITNCLIMGYLLNKMKRLDGFFFFLCFIPLLAGLFDYLENLGIITMLNTYPENPSFLSVITNICSVCKSGLTSVYFIALIFTLIELLRYSLLKDK